MSKKPSPAAARRPLPQAGEVIIRLVGNDKDSPRRRVQSFERELLFYRHHGLSAPFFFGILSSIVGYKKPNLSYQ